MIQNRGMNSNDNDDEHHLQHEFEDDDKMSIVHPSSEAKDQSNNLLMSV